MRYIVVATPKEIGLIKEFLPEHITDPVIVTGIGGTNVVRTLRDLPRDSEIINIGYAGSVDIPIGMDVSVGVVTTFHPGCEIIEPVLITDYGSGSVHCYTSTDFVTNGHRKGCVYDMELAFIAALGFKSLKAVKVVSDHCDYNEYNNTIQK